jgi:hypothetical protein
LPGLGAGTGTNVGLGRRSGNLARRERARMVRIGRGDDLKPDPGGV